MRSPRRASCVLELLGRNASGQAAKSPEAEQSSAAAGEDAEGAAGAGLRFGGGEAEGGGVGGVEQGGGEGDGAQHLTVVAGGEGEQAEGQIATAGDLADCPRRGVRLTETGGAQGRAGGEEGGGADRHPAGRHAEQRLARQRVDLRRATEQHQLNLSRAGHDGGVAEGDTIRRLVQRFEATIVGEAVAVSAPNPRGRAAGVERLDGMTLERAEARGKHLLLCFGELSLHSHLGMSGGWHLYRRGLPWRRPRRSAWAVLSGGGWDAVQFGGSTLEVMTTAKLRRHPQITSLGPDILDQELDLAAVAAAIRAADPGRELGDALLDQRLVAGIGNIFKSEACFAAKVDPWRPVGDLSEAELGEVLGDARKLMQGAVESGRLPFRIYRRREGVCPRCRGRISSRGQGDDSRTTYWCPRCQV